MGPPNRWRCLICRWPYGCTGYCGHDEGYAADWPEGLDYAGKRIVVIGSGVTAGTLVPALVHGPGAASHVTMLRRSPTHIVSQPGRDRVANGLRRLFPDGADYALSRWKNIVRQIFLFQLARRAPGLMKRLIRAGVRSALDLTSGYIRRVIDELPGQGWKLPWKLHQNFVRDLVALRFGRVDEPELEFG